MARWSPVEGVDGVWRFVQQDAGVDMFTSLAVQLSGGGVALVSPLPSHVQGDFAELETLGSPTFLLAPNHYHNRGLVPVSQRYPDILRVASAAALPRLKRRTQLAIGPLASLIERLPAGVSILQPEGLKQGEVWLRCETPDGVAWMVTDAFFNVLPLPTSVFGGFLWLTQGAPGLRIGGTFLGVGIGDRPRYRAWLRDQLAADRPTLLVPAHGVPVGGVDLANQLGEIVERRLG